MAQKLSASGSNLLVKVIDLKEEKSRGGIILPAGRGRGETLYGEVLSVGSEIPTAKASLAPAFKKGDVVVFERARCYEVPSATATLAFLAAADVLGTVEFTDEPEVVTAEKSRIVRPH